MTKKSPSPSPNSVWRKARKAEKSSRTTQSVRVSASQSPTTSIADIFKTKKKSATTGLQLKKANSKSSATLGIGIGSGALVRQAPQPSPGPRKSSLTLGIPLMGKQKFPSSRTKSSLSRGVSSRPRPRIREAEPEAPMDCSPPDDPSLSQSSTDSSRDLGSRSNSKSSISSGFIRTGAVLPDLSVLRSRNEVGNTVTSTPVEASRSQGTRIQDLSSSSSPENRTELDWNFSAIQETQQAEENLFTLTKRRQSPAEASPTLKAFKKPKVHPPTPAPSNDEEASQADVPTKPDVMEEDELTEVEQVAPGPSVEDAVAAPAVPEARPLPVIEPLPPVVYRKAKMPTKKTKGKETKSVPAVPKARPLPVIESLPPVVSKKTKMPTKKTKGKEIKSVLAQIFEESEELPDVSSQSSSALDEDDSGISSIRMRKTDSSPWNSSIDCINFSVNRDVVLESAFVYKSFDPLKKNKFKLEIYHASTGKMLLQEIEDSLRDTAIPEIGEMELEKGLRLESGRTYTAVLETRGRNSFCGSNGQSLSCCPIVDSMRHLIISYTKPSQDLLGKS